MAQKAANPGKDDSSPSALTAPAVWCRPKDTLLAQPNMPPNQQRAGPAGQKTTVAHQPFRIPSTEAEAPRTESKMEWCELYTNAPVLLKERGYLFNDASASPTSSCQTTASRRRAVRVQLRRTLDAAMERRTRATGFIAMPPKLTWEDVKNEAPVAGRWSDEEGEGGA